MHKLQYLAKDIKEVAIQDKIHLQFYSVVDCVCDSIYKLDVCGEHKIAPIFELHLK